MKRITAILVMLMLIATTLPAQAVRGFKSLWVECETASTVISGAFKSVTDLKASGGGLMKLDTVNEEPSEIQVNFTLSYDGEYDIFVLGTPANVDYLSIRKWKLNDGEYQRESSTSVGAGSSISDSRGVGTSWYKLGTAKLEKGLNSVSFYCDKKRTLYKDFMYTVVDSVVVVPSEWQWIPNGIDTKPFDHGEIKANYVSGSVSTEKLQLEDTLKIDAQYRLGAKTTGTPELYAELTYNGETVVKDSHKPTLPMKQWGVGIPVTEEFKVTLPFNAPSGIYEVRTGIKDIEFEDGTEYAVIDRIQVGDEIKEEVLPYTAEIKNAVIPKSIEKNKSVEINADIDISPDIDFETTPYLSLWKDELLYEVLEGTTKLSGESENVRFSAVLTSDMPEGVYEARIGVHNINSENSEVGKLVITGTDSVRSGYHKPMSYGNYYAKQTGKEHFWYVNQAGALIWDGEPYIPFGGMFVSKYLRGYNANNEAANKANFEQDKADLDEIRASGVNDLYINASSVANAPIWAWQYFLDYLEETGWEYGIQLGLGINRAGSAYYPRAAEASGRFKVENVTKSGEVTLAIPSSVPVSFSSAMDSIYIAIDSDTGELVDSGICSLRQNADGELVLTANVKLPNENAHTVYFTPQVYGGLGSTVNYWDNPEAQYERIDKYMSYFNAGDNLRMTIDILTNEMNMANKIETTRLSGEGFRKLFAGWLEKKYHNLDNLNRAWQVTPAVSDFEEAAALIPVYTSNKDEQNNSFSYFVDETNGKGYRVDTHSGVAWNDYINARDENYVTFNNKCSDIVKKYMDVPVIFKHVSVQENYLLNKDTVGGFDGIGAEAYGDLDVMLNKSGMPTAVNDQFARTAWSLITETNTLEDMTGKYDSGKWSYPSKEDMFARFNSALDIGIKGIYDFLLADRYDNGGKIGDAYGWITNKDTIKWGEEFQKNIDNPETLKTITKKKYNKDIFYFYPINKNWWYKPNERGTVQLLDDNYPFRRLKTENGVHVWQTDSLAVDTRLIFINLNDGPYTHVFGPELSKFLNEEHPDKRICVLGHRNDVGTIPEIDKYFTEEKVVINETESSKETVQILKPTETSEILKTTPDGKPWALKDGNLYILATDSFETHEGDMGTLHYVDELGVTDIRGLKGAALSSAPAQTGFSDMAGHWAEDAVNHMRKLGIANGVGENKFNPEGNITVAEFVSLIVRAMRYDKADNVSDDNWYSQTMAQASQNGLLTDKMLSEPERAITREEMAYVSAKAIGETISDFDISIYSDAGTVSEFARAAVGVASYHGIIEGMDDGTLQPLGNATRAQAIVIVKRIMDFK